MSPTTPQSPRPSPSRAGRLAATAGGIWIGGVAARALSLQDSAWAMAPMALGAVLGLGVARAFPRARWLSPVFVFLPLTLLPRIPGWRTLGAAALIFILATALDRWPGLDDPARARNLLLGLLLIGGGLATAVGLLRIYWLADVEYGQDTAYEANLLWNTLHGRFLRSGLLQDLLHHPPLRNDLGAHNSPLQLLLLPAFWIWPSPALLILLRNALLWVSPWLLFRHLRGDAAPRAALLLSLALATQTTVLWQSANAFYFVQLCLPVLVLLIAAWERGSLPAAIGWLVLLFGFREDLAVVAVALGGVALLQRRRWPWVLLPPALGGIWWIVSTRFVMPAGGASAGGAVSSTLAAAGGTPLGILSRALADPGPFLRMVLRQENLEMALDLACSLGWVGLVSPLGLVAVPFAGITALVDFSPAKDVFMHYHLLPVPFVLVGGYRLLQRFGRDRALVGTLALGLLCSMVVENTRLLPIEQTARALRPSNGDLRRAVVEAVDGAESIGAPGAYLPSLAGRRELFLSSRLWQYDDARPSLVIWDPDTFRANPLPSERDRYLQWPARAVEAGAYRVRDELPEDVLVLERVGTPGERR